MHSVKIKNNGKPAFDGHLPGSWEEVTAEQFRRIFHLLFSIFPPLPTPELRRRLLLSLLFKNKFRYKATMHMMAGIDIFELTEKITFIWQSSSPIAFIKSFRHRLCRYYLPDSYLNNAVCIEFIYADSYLESIARFEGDINKCEELNMLVATLCRPRKWFWWFRKRLSSYDGDIRERFNPSLMKSRAKRFEKLPLQWKLYVLAYFIACKKNIVEDPAYNLIFPQKKKKKKAEASNEEGSSWAEVLKDVAGTKLYGSYDETAWYNLHTMLTNMQFDNKKAKALRKK